jgi:hypothetical protein
VRDVKAVANDIEVKLSTTSERSDADIGSRAPGLGGAGGCVNDIEGVSMASAMSVPHLLFVEY